MNSLDRLKKKLEQFDNFMKYSEDVVTAYTEGNQSFDDVDDWDSSDSDY